MVKYFLFQIRSLNALQLHDLQSGSLVRFRCMIQETFEPEYYMEKYEIKNKLNGTMVIGFIC